MSALQASRDPVFDLIARLSRAEHPDAIDVRLVGGPLDGSWATAHPHDVVAVVEVPESNSDFYERFIAVRVTPRQIDAGIRIGEEPNYRGEYVGAQLDDGSLVRVWNPAS